MSGYNGWSNRETWLLNLWISNEQGSAEHAQEIAREAWTRVQGEPADLVDRSVAARVRLAEWLESEYQDAANDLLDAIDQSASVWSDLLSTALSRVDWIELADTYLSDESLDGYVPRGKVVQS